jgi:hypothetical protein
MRSEMKKDAEHLDEEFREILVAIVRSLRWRGCEGVRGMAQHDQTVHETDTLDARSA